MPKTRVMFVYWGRRGALSQFTLEVARAALKDEKLSTTISVSRQNELISSFEEFGPALLPIDTFSHGVSAVLQAWRIPRLRQQLYDRIRSDETQAVIELIPHVWSFLLMPVVRKAGARYCTVIHDADAHPGDRSGLMKGLLDRVLPMADTVFTLSGAVAGRLEASGLAPVDKISILHHPDLTYSVRRPRPPRQPGGPVRLLFLGRIMAYKGLNLFIDTAERLRRDGVPVEIGVFGEGRLGQSEARLQAMGAEIVNRWLTSEEIADALSRYDAVVLSHTEASQSGVAATAFGAGVPVVATPVGGLIEQVVDGVTGVLAKQADSDALADAVKLLFSEPGLYESVCANLVRTSEDRSMAKFIEDIVMHSVKPVIPTRV